MSGASRAWITLTNHLFLPPKLPQHAPSVLQESETNILLTETVLLVTEQYASSLHEEQGIWRPILKMLKNLLSACQIPLSKASIRSDLSQMETNDVLVYHIRAQNACVLVRKLPDEVIFEIFEVSLQNERVMSTEGKLRCSYPLHAIAIPESVFSDESFQMELASFLAQMDVDEFDDATPKTKKAGTKVSEIRDTVDPHHVTQLLVAILGGLGRVVVDVKRTSKRIADEVLWHGAEKPWRRSPLWLVIRVALQRTLEHRHRYKPLILVILCRVLYKAIMYNFNSDLMFTMRAKVSRRCYKLSESPTPTFVYNVVEVCVKKVTLLLQDRWKTIQDEKKLPPLDPDNWDIAASTTLTIPQARSYIRNVLARENTVVRSSFSPDDPLRLGVIHDLAQFASGKLTAQFRKQGLHTLHDFEESVLTHANSWTHKNLTKPSACSIIATCFQQYYQLAKEQYTNSPEDKSIMILILMQLWVILDTITCQQFSLLRDYDPDIPITFLEPILLRHHRHISCVDRVEQYILDRRQKAKYSSVFSDTVTSSSISVRHFNQSSTLQDLKSRMEAEANIARSTKRAELEKLNDVYQTLRSESSILNHTQTRRVDEEGDVHITHSATCTKCRLEKAAANLFISIHEWPLPEARMEAEMVVFELACPKVFSIWRNITFDMLCMVGSPNTQVKPAGAEHDLHGSDIKKWIDQASSKQITLASTAKQFTRSHYKSRKIPANDSDVLLPHGSRWRLYDCTSKTWASHRFSHTDLSSYGTLHIPAGSPYTYLQHTLAQTIHTSNSVLAEQDKCPAELTLHEHIAFGSLRSGGRIQWLNIIRELASNSLSFEREEVHQLIVQATCQLGPRSSRQSSSAREWHEPLTDPHYVLSLLDVLSTLLVGVKANWRQVVTLKTIAMVVGRVLASQQPTADSRITVQAYKLLRNARSAAYRWIQDLEQTLELLSEPDEIQECSQRLLVVSATCRSTYDVDSPHLAQILATETDLRIFIHCAFIIYRHTPARVIDMAPDVQRLLSREYRLRHFAHDLVVQRVEEGNLGLDQAVQAIWVGFSRKRSKPWVPVDPSSKCWWVAQVTRQTIVHCNLLDGQFLVNGKTLGKLPKSYMKHSLYQRIFGNRVFDVVPSPSPSMDFASRHLFHNHQLSFAHREGQLIIQACRGQAENADDVWELIPNTTFSEELPYSFVHHYSHWLNLKTGIVEFRPLTDTWSMVHDDVPNFQLDIDSWQLSQGGSTGAKLVDVHSNIFVALSSCLSSLEETSHTVIMHHPVSGVSVQLPRHHLTFRLNGDSQLESVNMRGYVVDDDQAAGTMFGLHSKLVLRKGPSQATHTPGSRMILVPFGTISVERTDHHVSVHVINPDSQPTIDYHKFMINDTLGSLSNEGGMKSWFYMLYLHAVTSHCLPDPLLKRTGTEEALHGLKSARSFSFTDLKSDILLLLEKLSALTPQRRFYPAHLQKMQSTTWHPSLHPLSQHNSFASLVAEILAHFNTLRIFSEREAYSVGNSGVSEHLTRRADRRCSPYYCQAVLGVTSVYEKDDYYRVPLDSLQARTSILLPSFRIAEASHKDLAVLICPSSSLWAQMYSWSRTCTIRKTPIERDPIKRLSYERAWLSDDFEGRWLEILHICLTHKHAYPQRRYATTFTFASMVYTTPSMEQMAFIYIAILASPAIDISTPPSPISSTSGYTLRDGFVPQRETLRGILRLNARTLNSSPSGRLTRKSNERKRSFENRRDQHWEDGVGKALNTVTTHLLSQGPGTRLTSPPGSDVHDWLDVSSGLQQAGEYFSSCRKNAALKNYITAIELLLLSNHPTIFTGDVSRDADGVTFIHKLMGTLESAALHWKSDTQPSLPTLHSLLERSSSFDTCVPPDHRFGSPMPQMNEVPSGSTTPSNPKPQTAELEKMFTRLEIPQGNSSKLRNLYVDDLRRSSNLLKHDDGHLPRHVGETNSLLQYNDSTAEKCEALLSRIRRAISPSTRRERILAEAGQWPSVYPRVLLQQLNIHSRSANAQDAISGDPPEYYKALVYFAECLLERQRSMRLLDHHLYGRTDDFASEVKNCYFDWHEALREPDWLLVQLEGNFLARRVQVEIASEMIRPPSGRNTALQLNMGEGKSSVIVPMVAATLANREQLLRVVVLKPLSSQMFELLTQRLGGLCNRRIYYIPFSRKTPVGNEDIGLIRCLYQQCMALGGVLVAQPEHILSLKLMAVDRAISVSPWTSAGFNGGIQNAQALQEVQTWLADHSRDILDESDEILHTRYQLIYTVGHHEPIENHPDRWGIIQSVLNLAREHALRLHGLYPANLEIHPRAGSFPIIRVLDRSISRELSRLIVDDAFNNKIPTLSLAFMPPTIRTMIREFVMESNIVYSSYHQLNDYLQTNGSWKSVLLLRGLLASGRGILHYVLSERRWKVDYGHDLHRSLLAVPYRAKDVPSLRAEFGHPDVALSLTCLTYYYAGLTKSQLRHCFDLLYKLDDPALEYSNWVRQCHQVPDTLHRLSGVNIDDPEQFDNILLPLFQHNSTTADFFLSQVVFPKEAKSFPYKLVTSGWDLIEDATNGCRTTGFSGTNDNRFLLPTSITQYSREEQLSTNALVLSYLLQPENNAYFHLFDEYQQPLTAIEFLNKLTTNHRRIRVLLDVGAQMLELGNEALARCWLSLRSDVLAAVFFDEADELTVLTQEGIIEPLSSSSFRQRLDACVVYLDDAHTRGTDLKLPRDACAAVTLGPKVTKDRLVQGCMRMRKLGHGQTVMFCASHEVDQRIRKLSGLSPDVTPQVPQIIEWAIQETLLDIERYIPQWSQNGVDHSQRQKAYSDYRASADVGTLRDAWRQRESKTLEELYGWEPTAFNDLNHSAFRLAPVRDRLISFGMSSLSHPGFGEEQEREVSQELVQEREVERPPRVFPATPSVHRVVRKLVQTGICDTNSPQFVPATNILKCRQRMWPSGLYMTKDFTLTTISVSSLSSLDFLNLVHWIVSAKSNSGQPVWVIFSPYEVNELLPAIRDSFVTLHIFNPRVTRWMPSLLELSFYTISGVKELFPTKPSSDIQGQLILISGQVYLDSMEMYGKVEELLGIRKVGDGGSSHIECDVVVLDSVKDLVGSRRKGMGYRDTHLGKILQLRPLSNVDFE